MVPAPGNRFPLPAPASGIAGRNELCNQGGGSDAGSSTRPGGSNVATAGKRFDPAVDLEGEERGGKSTGGHSRVTDELIEGDRIMAHRIENVLFLRSGTSSRTAGTIRRRGLRDDRRPGQYVEMHDFLDNVHDRLHQLCSIANERMTSRDRGLSTDPGTAKTSRPSSAAKRAVINEPLRSDASTTSTPTESPLIRRFRRGKFSGSGGVPGARSVTTAPASRSSRASPAFDRG